MLAHYGRYLVSKQGTTHGSPSAPEEDVPCAQVPRSYEDYLASPHWTKIRKESSKLWGDSCLVCGHGGVIHRHHLFYRERWLDTLAREVIPLCEACHSATHLGGANKNPVPTTDEELNQIVIRMVRAIDEFRMLGLFGLVTDVLNRFWKGFGRARRASVSQYPKTESRSAKRKRLKREGKKGLSRSKWLRKRHRFQWGV